MEKITIEQWKSEFAELLQVPKCTTYTDYDVIMSAGYTTESCFLHRTPGLGPVFLTYDIKGRIRFASYFMNDIIHRNQNDGPSEIKFHKNGSISHQIYCINGRKHRDGKPAAIYYDKNGNIRSEEYYMHGKLHRIDGPAKIRYSETGTIRKKEYYLGGQKSYKIIIYC